jgi:hypothetical protein
MSHHDHAVHRYLRGVVLMAIFAAFRQQLNEFGNFAASELQRGNFVNLSTTRMIAPRMTYASHQVSPETREVYRDAINAAMKR